MATYFSFRAACVLLSFVSLSGCAWTGDSPSLPPQDRAIADPLTDPHMARFYALQAEIDRLQRERDQLAERLVSAGSASQPDSTVEDENSLRPRHRWNSRVNAMLSRLDALRERVRHQPLTDGALEAVRSTPDDVQKVAQSPSPESMASASTPQISTSPWHYSVAYRYDEHAPWRSTWARLEAVGERDKWRGSYPDKQRYFIYVGVYAGKHMAGRRAAELAERVGEKPVILARQKVAQLQP